MNDLIDFARAGDILSFANTPRYIIKHLRREQSVSDLSRKFSGQRLYDEIRRIDNIGDPEFDDYAKAYVLIVAISLQCEEYTGNHIKEFSETGFRWAREISEILIRERIETTMARAGISTLISAKNSDNHFNTNFGHVRYDIEAKKRRIRQNDHFGTDAVR